jgi:hypothetical protein
MYETSYIKKKIIGILKMRDRQATGSERYILQWLCKSQLIHGTIFCHFNANARTSYEREVKRIHLITLES